MCQNVKSDDQKYQLMYHLWFNGHLKTVVTSSQIYEYFPPFITSGEDVLFFLLFLFSFTKHIFKADDYVLLWWYKPLLNVVVVFLNYYFDMLKNIPSPN